VSQPGDGFDIHFRVVAEGAAIAVLESGFSLALPKLNGQDGPSRALVALLLASAGGW
jgi:hypothetical protein